MWHTVQYYSQYYQILVFISFLIPYNFRDNGGTLQDKEIDDNESELNSSQTQSSQVRLVDDKEILHLNQTGVDDDIQEFDSDQNQSDVIYCSCELK